MGLPHPDAALVIRAHQHTHCSELHELQRGPLSETVCTEQNKHGEFQIYAVYNNHIVHGYQLSNPIPACPLPFENVDQRRDATLPDDHKSPA